MGGTAGQGWGAAGHVAMVKGNTAHEPGVTESWVWVLGLPAIFKLCGLAQRLSRFPHLEWEMP